MHRLCLVESFTALACQHSRITNQDQRLALPAAHQVTTRKRLHLKSVVLFLVLSLSLFRSLFVYLCASSKRWKSKEGKKKEKRERKEGKEKEEIPISFLPDCRGMSLKIHRPLRRLPLTSNGVHPLTSVVDWEKAEAMMRIIDTRWFSPVGLSSFQLNLSLANNFKLIN